MRPLINCLTSVVRSAGLSRTHVVWACLLISMTAVGGLLLVSESQRTPYAGQLPPTAVALEQPATLDDLFDTTSAIDELRWAGVVIHHSGDISGSPDSLDRQATDAGLRGIGYHFIIGNGRGMSDGHIHATFRWDQQLPGAHAIGPDADSHNRTSIGICLVGDGDRRAFTPQQMASLVALLKHLRDRCGLDAEDVQLHREISPTSSPGRLFPATIVRGELAAGL